MKYTDETMSFHENDDTKHDDLPLEELSETTEENTLTIPPEGEDFFISSEETTQEDTYAEAERERPAKKSRRKKKTDDLSEEETYAEPSDEQPSYETENSEEDYSEDLESLSQLEDLTEEDKALLSTLPITPERHIRRYMDESGRMVTDNSTPFREEYQRLSSAMNRRRFLTGYIEGLELNSADIPRAFLFYGDIKVLIPVTQLDLPLSAEQLDDPLETRLTVNGMLGAKIYFFPLNIDFQNKIAVASRKIANRLRRQSLLGSKDNDGNFRIAPGTVCTAQIIHIARYFVRIDIYGFETTVGVSAISNNWVNDAREALTIGSEVLVEITDITREDNGIVTGINASIRLAEQVSEVEAEAGKTYTGTIVGFSPIAYFVKLAGADKTVRCPIRRCYTDRLLEVGDFVKFFIHGVGNGEPSGSILRILKKSENSMID